MRILHLIIDHQVIERMLDVFESVFPTCNDVLVFSDTSVFKHLNKHSLCHCISKDTVKKEGRGFDFSPYNYIVAHYLTLEMVDFIGYAPKNIHVCWEIYGADLYNEFLVPMGFKLQYTDTYKYSSPIKKIIKKLGVFNLLSSIRTGNFSQLYCVRKNYFKKITNRLDSIEVGCMGDARLLESYSRKTYDTYKCFNYSLKQTLGDLYGGDFANGDDIMIGNSASLSNNHLYSLSFINRFNIGNSKIIMPLSYGGFPEYKNDVMAEYKNSFAEKIVFLLDYMPLNEYNRIFQNIKTMVMTAWRQESIGTITMGLYMGIKIYMSKKSPLYLSLKEEGFYLYEIESVNENEFVTPLSEKEKKHNRELLLQLYNENVFEAELRRQFN